VHVQDDHARETTMDSGRMVGPRRRVDWVRKRRPEGKPELVGPMTHGEEGTVMVGTVPCSGGGEQKSQETFGNRHKEMDDHRGACEVGSKRKWLVSAAGREIVRPMFLLGPVGCGWGYQGSMTERRNQLIQHGRNSESGNPVSDLASVEHGRKTTAPGTKLAPCWCPLGLSKMQRCRL
jgi:hypothetical protein